MPLTDPEDASVSLTGVNSSQVSGLAAHMNKHDSFRRGMFTDTFLQQFRSKDARSIVNIQENRIGFEITQDFSRGGKGHRRNKDLIALSDSDRFTGQVERCRAELTAQAYKAPTRPEKALSRSKHFPPVVSQPDSRVSRMYFISFPSQTIRQKGIFSELAISSPFQQKCSKARPTEIGTSLFYLFRS